MRNLKTAYVLIAIAALQSGNVLAQTAALPKALSGHWTAVIPGRQTYSDSISMVLDAPGADGSVTGRLTTRGVGCGSQDEPLTGSWDGSVLRVESKVRPNVNAQRMNGDCASGRLTLVLTRKPGQAAFEGEALRDGSSIPSQITMSP